MSGAETDRPQWKPTWKDGILASVGFALFIALIVLCILFYNWAGLDWLLYLGWAILAVGIVLGMMPHSAFQRKGRAREGGRWLQTTVVVDSGVYAVVRHPMYLSFILVILALILICQHWSSPIVGVPLMGYLCIAIRGEDKVDIEKFGDDYERYMQSVPRVNLILGVIRLLRRRARRR